jgi:hypothetical protein
MLTLTRRLQTFLQIRSKCCPDRCMICANDDCSVTGTAQALDKHQCLLYFCKTLQGATKAECASRSTHPPPGAAFTGYRHGCADVQVCRRVTRRDSCNACAGAWSTHCLTQREHSRSSWHCLWKGTNCGFPVALYAQGAADDVQQPQGLGCKPRKRSDRVKTSRHKFNSSTGSKLDNFLQTNNISLTAQTRGAQHSLTINVHLGAVQHNKQDNKHPTNTTAQAL